MVSKTNLPLAADSAGDHERSTPLTSAEAETYKARIHEGFGIFTIEREHIKATEIFSKATAKSLKKGREARARHEKEVEQGTTVDHPITTDEHFHIIEDEISPELRQQRIQGKQLEEQAAALLDTALLAEVKGVYFTEARHLIKKHITAAALKISTLAMRTENIALRHGGARQIELSWRTFLNEWQPGIDLYKPLRSAYEAYHAQMVGYLPEDLIGQDMSELIEQPQDLTIEGPPVVTAAVKNKRYLGLYDTILIDRETLSPERYWVSQDQIGRYELTRRMMSNLEMLVDENPERQVTVIDYAGGVGNSTAAMIEQIDKTADPARREKMIACFRVVIRDINTGQLEGGRVKFKEMEKTYPWIAGKYVFVESNVTKDMNLEQLQTVKDAFGEEFELYDTTLIGMTSYTAGALPGFVVNDMAQQIKGECYYFSANDFSNPAFREKQFLEQTGAYGQEYLEVQHGRAKAGSSKFRQMWVKGMSLCAGLAKHYNYTWPGEWGHNAGYGVQDNGELRQSSILELAGFLDEDAQPDEHVQIKSTVNSFSYLYTGKGTDSDGKEKVRVAVIPGWVRDDISVYREANRIPKNEQK